MTAIDLRLACETDLVAINDIYNHYVLHSTCTYHIDPISLDERRAWFAAHDAVHPVTVALRGQTIVGWGSLSTYHDRSGYRFTVENSVYVHPDFHRQKIGHTLLADLLARARALGHHTIIAGIGAEQTASIELHRRFGFVDAGRIHQVGFKFDQWLDVVYLQKMVGDGS